MATARQILSALVTKGHGDLAQEVLVALLDQGIISREEFEKIRKEWQKARMKVKKKKIKDDDKPPHEHTEG
jgi:multidrug resistance efflux pump